MNCWIKWPAAAGWMLGLVMLGNLLLSACSTSNPVTDFLFYGGLQPFDPPYKHSPRRQPYKKPQPPTIVETPDLPPPIDWRARFDALEKSADGGVDWVLALNDKVITPKPGLVEGTEEEEPTDMDLEFIPKDQPEYKVVFQHKPHTQWLGCPNCHTDIFEMEQGKAQMTMDKINAGAYCGVCHGKVALPNLDSCPTCHKAM